MIVFLSSFIIINYYFFFIQIDKTAGSSRLHQNPVTTFQNGLPHQTTIKEVRGFFLTPPPYCFACKNEQNERLCILATKIVTFKRNNQIRYQQSQSVVYYKRKNTVEAQIQNQQMMLLSSTQNLNIIGSTCSLY